MQNQCKICNSTKLRSLLKKTINIAKIGNVIFSIVICKSCGFIFQNPSPPQKKINDFYKNNYTYSSRIKKKFRVSKKIILGVKDQVETSREFINQNSKILQIGSSQGYTLSQFKKISKNTLGIEPSSFSSKFANSMKIKTINNFFENVYKKIQTKFDFVILTHVLEHIKDPVNFLKKIKETMKTDGKLLIEVPLFSNQKYLPINYFTFEHLNYFSKTALENIISISGFKFEKKIQKDYHLDDYPIQRTIVSNNMNKTFKLKSDFKKNNYFSKQLIKKEINAFKKIVTKIRNTNNIFIVWGAGIHSSLLFSKIDRNIIKKIKFFIDIDKTKYNYKLYKKKIISPEKFKQKFKHENYTILISSISTKEILETIKNLKLKSKIIKIY